MEMYFGYPTTSKSDIKKKKLGSILEPILLFPVEIDKWNSKNKPRVSSF